MRDLEAEARRAAAEVPDWRQAVDHRSGPGAHEPVEDGDAEPDALEEDDEPAALEEDAEPDALADEAEGSAGPPAGDSQQEGEEPRREN